MIIIISCHVSVFKAKSISYNLNIPAHYILLQNAEAVPSSVTLHDINRM